MSEKKCTKISYDGREVSCSEELHRKDQLQKMQQKAPSKSIYIRFNIHTEKEYMALIDTLKELPFEVSMPKSKW